MSVEICKSWFQAMKRLDHFGDKTKVYCCEDHFNIENDMENYIKFKLVGGRVKLKKDIVPHKFECQEEKKRNSEKSAMRKRDPIKCRKKLLIGDNTSLDAAEGSEEIFVGCSEDEEHSEDPLGFENYDQCSEKSEENKEEEKIMSNDKSICFRQDKVSVRDDYQLCCCCQELVCVRSLWSQYTWMGKIEVYGDMLKDCFNVTWPQRDGSKDLICGVCITQLRNAVNFKDTVLKCQSVLESKILDSNRELKEEYSEDNNQSSNDKYNNQMYTGPNRAIKTESAQDNQTYIDSYSDNIAVMNTDIEIEFVKNNLTNDDYDEVEVDRSHLRINTVKRKMNGLETSKRPIRKRPDTFDRKSRNYIYPRQNVGLILEHSTIVPFKSSNGYFNCFYCNKQFAAFEQLKTHVGEQHENINFKLILKNIRRPLDPIRADISDIRCRKCNKKIDNLDSLVQHLTDEHNVKFNFDIDSKKPAECILPYDLSDGKYRCYKCKDEFLFYKTLTFHMNKHSTEHVCDVCGRCFLLADRLRAHKLSHKEKGSGSVKCDLCGKIYGSKMLLKSHMRYKHQKVYYMCSICDKSFLSCQKRLQHLEKVHKRAAPNLNCKSCSKKFVNHKSLYAHMRSDHLNIKKEAKYGCNVCGMMFKSNHAVAQHMVGHSGEKNYECEVCHKKYGRRKTLAEHMRIHLNDRRFACGACSQAFVQKCTLKNHIRVHHSNMDFQQLIVDRKTDAK